MTIDQLSKIEKNKKFRRHICNKDIWRNYAFVPPSLVLFSGMMGLVYLFKEDMLISLNSIPFIVIFLLGTIWFKSTKKYLIDKKIKAIESLELCEAIPLKVKDNNYSYYFFASNNNRLNLNYLEKQLEKIEEEINVHNTQYFVNKANLVKNNDLFISKVKKSKKKNIMLALLNKEHTLVLTKKEIIKYK